MIAELLNAILSLQIFLIAIVVHELGHVAAFRFYGIKVKLRFERRGKGFKFKVGVPETYQALEDHQKCIIYTMGVGLGWVFMALCFSLLNIDVIFLLFWFLVYFYSCQKDMSNFIKCWKRID